jgi:protocatechuate 3,4-dioxygenase, alpha subunit
MSGHRTQTPSQTVGPFFAIGLVRASEAQHVVATPLAFGEHIQIEGQLIDGAGTPVPDALIEVWQANAAGEYPSRLPAGLPAVALAKAGALAEAGPAAADSTFRGYGRCATDPQGRFTFETVKPGAIRDGSGQAPHVNVIVFARGMLLHAFTRMYFADDPLDADPVLMSIDPARRRTLVAQREPGADDSRYIWEIHLQGDRETVFFDA